MVPDSLYRHLDRSLESNTHFFDLDIALGFASPFELAKVKARSAITAASEKIPEDGPEALTTFQTKLGAEKAAKLGSVPWRVEQFLVRADRELSEVHEIPGGYQAGQSATGSAAHLYRALYELGVMSHYSGDAAMPYHATADWNGYATGEGGIHFYFETDCVDALEPGLSTQVFSRAKARESIWLKDWGYGEPTRKVLRRRPMRAVLELLADSTRRLKHVSEIDLKSVVLTRSVGQAPARRKPALEACGAFREVLVESLAQGAVLTAQLWRQVAPPGGVDPTREPLHFSDLEWASQYVKPEFLKPGWLVRE